MTKTEALKSLGNNVLISTNEWKRLNAKASKLKRKRLAKQTVSDLTALHLLRYHTTVSTPASRFFGGDMLEADPRWLAEYMLSLNETVPAHIAAKAKATAKEHYPDIQRRTVREAQNDRWYSCCDNGSDVLTEPREWVSRRAATIDARIRFGGIVWADDSEHER